MSNLSEIKQKLGYETLNLNAVVIPEVKDATGAIVKPEEKTDWLRMWDNDNRVSVVIHKDTLKQIKDKPGISSLGINTKVKTGSKGEFTVKTIVAYTEADEVL